MITPAQCRAARGLLDWSQQQAADAANVGVVTIRQFESGGSQPRAATVDVVVRAFERAGVIFVEENGDGPGVRRRKAAPTAEAIAAKIEKLEAKADALKPGEGPPSPAKALKTMKRAVVKNEVRKLRNKLAGTERRPKGK